MKVVYLGVIAVVIGCGDNLRGESCGSCAGAPHVATTSCTNGSCAIATCADGFADCANGFSDGCETDITQARDCGSCGNTCAAPNAAQANVVASCNDGTCGFACADGYADCNGDVEDALGDGCEAALDTLPTCGGCSGVNAQGMSVATCTDDDACTMDVCTDAATCANVPLLACSTPGNEAFCKLAGSCAMTHDLDGDGLADEWEVAGGYDFNCDGAITADEKVLTDVDPVYPDGGANPNASADPSVKDVFVKYDWMELADQGGACVPTPMPACPSNPTPADQPCADATNKLQFSYPFYSSMCAFDEQCIAGTCVGHSDRPDPLALQMVVEAFRRHGIRLHLVAGGPVAHANVISFGAPIADCVNDLSLQTYFGSQAVDYYALKAANFHATFGAQSFDGSHLAPVFHYIVFGHHHSCDSTNDCSQAACVNPDTGRNPTFGETGIAEQPGNDAIISEGSLRDLNKVPGTLLQAGTIMHELGHNLGLDHGGPLFVAGVAQGGAVRLNYKPNYISVMNYSHQGRGIDAVTAPGTTGQTGTVTATMAAATVVGTGTEFPTDGTWDGRLLTIGTASMGLIASVADATHLTLRVAATANQAGTFKVTRVDYSRFTQTPNTLLEDTGTEAAGIALGTNDVGYIYCPIQTGVPGTGPVDFSCGGGNMQTWCAVGCDFPFRELNNNDGATPDGTPGSGDTLLPFEDWPNLTFTFQCAPTYNDGAVEGGASSEPELTIDQLIARGDLYPSVDARIDVRPGCDTNWIAPGTMGSVPVALLGQLSFDVTHVSLPTLRFAGVSASHASVVDVNGDGYVDLLIEFPMAPMTLTAADHTATLTGALASTQTLSATDAITVVHSPRRSCQTASVVSGQTGPAATGALGSP